MSPKKQQKMDALYIDLAKRISQESYANRAKVGALLVKNDNICSFGWNGTVSGSSNCCELPDGTTDPSVLHAESNVLLKLLKSDATVSTAGSTLYTTLSPCFECSKLIVQAGISRVVYLDEYRILDGIDFLKKRNVIVDKFVYEN